MFTMRSNSLPCKCRHKTKIIIFVFYIPKLMTQTKPLVATPQSIYSAKKYVRYADTIVTFIVNVLS